MLWLQWLRVLTFKSLRKNPSWNLYAIQAPHFSHVCFLQKPRLFLMSDFFVVNCSHKAARHVCFCVFIHLAVAFYTAFISVTRHGHDMSHFKFTSVEYSYGCGFDSSLWKRVMVWGQSHAPSAYGIIWEDAGQN